MPTRLDGAATTEFDVAAFAPLLRRPERGLEGRFKGLPYSARIAIPDYGERVARHYAGVARDGLAAAGIGAGIAFELPRFGLIVEFDQAASIRVHAEDMVLDDSIRALIARFGAVFFRNARIAGAARRRFHRNIFPHLRFHVDRGANAVNQYSCFTRDPGEAEQRPPRDSSTLFIANIVAWLELVRSGGCDPSRERGVRAKYDLYGDCAVAELFGQVVLEQPWDAPEGSGEIAVIDNRTVLHATYHKDGETRGYPIGARYLV